MIRTLKLQNTDRNAKVEYLSRVSSTNTLLKGRMPSSFEDKDIEVVIADSQSSGRGRLGRTFYSDAKCGLYMSFRVYGNEIESISNLTPIAAVSVAESLEEMTGKSFDIKWVNDIYYQSKKVCGILTEGVFDTSGTLSYAIVGIGVNIAEPVNGYNDEIRSIAGAAFEKYTDEIRDELSLLILSKFFKYLKLPADVIYKSYKKRLLVLGGSVRVILANEEYNAKVIDLCSDFALKVEKADGTICELKSGEISIKI